MIVVLTLEYIRITCKPSEYRQLTSIPQVSDLVSLDGVPELAFLTSSQALLMLLVQRPTLRTTSLGDGCYCMPHYTDEAAHSSGVYKIKGGVRILSKVKTS